MIELYHAAPASNSLKVLLCLQEKGIDFISRPVDLAAFEQFEDWFLKINPDGQVPVLVHDHVVITESTVINEYLDQVFPGPDLRPHNPIEQAHMRQFTKYVDEWFRPALSYLAWQATTHFITDKMSKEAFEAKLARIPREEKREKWRISAAQGYSPEQQAAWRRTLQEGVGKMEAALAKRHWLAGPHYSLADIAMFAMAAHMPKRYDDFVNTQACPRVMEWLGRMHARPAVQRALATKTPPRIPGVQTAAA
jgi:glutathione S-transferase